MDAIHPLGDGHTLLPEEDRAGLRLFYVTTRGELDEAEGANIVRAAATTPPRADRILDDLYVRSLHRRMFENVWEWAGRYRLRDTNLGIAYEGVPVAVRNLVDDTRAWIEAGDEPDAVALRFHHRLVAIHPFPNGNGRHARLIADQLAIRLERPRFTWGANLVVDTPTLRARYIAALRAADLDGTLGPLVDFARS